MPWVPWMPWVQATRRRGIHGAPVRPAPRGTGVGLPSVLEVLSARPRYRQHIGAVLRVAAADRHGRWIAVALIEEGDDQYLIVAARELDELEQTAVRRLLEGGRS